MDKQIKVGKIYSQDIVLYTLTGVFNVTVGGVEFSDTNLMRLVNKIENSDIVVLDEKILYKSSTDTVETKTIKRLDSYGQYFYDECNRQNGLSNAYPITELNQQIFKKMRQTSNSGWKLIRKADRMVEDLEKFPKNHFSNILQKVLDERTKKLNKGGK